MRRGIPLEIARKSERELCAHQGGPDADMAAVPSIAERNAALQQMTWWAKLGSRHDATFSFKLVERAILLV
jgi:hypothetical protein